MQNLESVLESKGLLSEFSGESSIDGDDIKESSVFIVILQAISGMLSSILILAFLVLTLGIVFESTVAMVVLGLLFLGIAYMLLRKKSNDFLEYFALVFAMAGEWFLLFGLGELLQLNETMSIVGIMLTFMVLFFIIDSALHRFVSALIVLWAGYYLTMLFNLSVFYYALVTLGMVWLWLHEYSHISKMKYIQSLGYACVVFLLYMTMAQMQLSEFAYGLNILPFREENIIDIPSFVYSVVHFLMVAISTGMILKKLGLSVQDKLLWFTGIGALIFAFSQPMLLSLFVPMLVLALAFYGQNKVLYILGFVAMVLNIFSFYYMTFIDFMTKSKTLVVFGSIVLVLALVLHLYLRKQEEVQDA